MLDPHIGLWVLEFVLRQPIEDWVAHELLLALPLPPRTILPHRLYTTLLLRRLASFASRRLLSSKTLLSLELLHHFSPHPRPSLPAAYSAAALHLAARELRLGDLDAFSDAVDVVFRRRIGDLERSGMGEGLVGEELREIKRVVEAAAEGDERAREEVMRRDTAKEAADAVRRYLKEEAVAMGPSFLELAAQAVIGEGVGGRLVDLVDKHKGRVAARSRDVSRSYKFNPLPTPDVSKVKVALKLSCTDLQMVVEDPLPDAAAAATEVLASMTQEVNLGVSRENQNVVQKGARDPAVGLGGEATSTDGIGTGGVWNRGQGEAVPSSSPLIVNPSDPKELARKQTMPGRNGSTCLTDKGAEVICNEGTSNGVAKRNREGTQPSLMDRNPTARTYEWDDSIDSPSDTSLNSARKPCLPSPKRRAVSPLKLLENKKFLRRRKVKKWSVLEEDTLREAVKKYGKGNWKAILNSYPDIFEGRTEVDLKDKWRNMTGR